MWRAFAASALGPDALDSLEAFLGDGASGAGADPSATHVRLAGPYVADVCEMVPRFQGLDGPTHIALLSSLLTVACPAVRATPSHAHAALSLVRGRLAAMSGLATRQNPLLPAVRSRVLEIATAEAAAAAQAGYALLQQPIPALKPQFCVHFRAQNI